MPRCTVVPLYENDASRVFLHAGENFCFPVRSETYIIIMTQYDALYKRGTTMEAFPEGRIDGTESGWVMGREAVDLEVTGAVAGFPL